MHNIVLVAGVLCRRLLNSTGDSEEQVIQAVRDVAVCRGSNYRSLRIDRSIGLNVS